MSISTPNITTAADINTIITNLNNGAARRGNTNRVTATTAAVTKESASLLTSMSALVDTLNKDHAAVDAQGNKISGVVTHTYGPAIVDPTVDGVQDSSILPAPVLDFPTAISRLAAQTCGCNTYTNTYCCNAQCCNTVHCCDCHNRSGAFSRDRVVACCVSNACTCNAVCGCEIQ